MAITNEKLAELMGAVTSGADNTATLNAAYQKAFGRDADADGLTYWGGRLDDGLAVADLMTALLGGVDKYPTDGTFATENTADKAVVVNKTAVAEAIEANAFVTPAEAATILATVTSDAATVTSATASVDAITDPALVGDTFTLTTGTETITGTDNDDVINGVTSTLTSAKTLDTTDIIDGGEGTDTLNITMNANFTGLSGDGAITNVENINLNNNTTVAKTFNALGITGVEKYTITVAEDKAGVSTITNMETVAAVALDGQKTDFTTSFATGAAELTGTSDTMNVSVNNVGTAADNTVTPVVAEDDVVLTLANIENLALTATGVNVLDLSAAATKTIAIAGAGDVKVTDIDSTVTSFDASESTGNINVDTTSSTVLTTLGTGAGDDTITVDASTFLANGEITGGEGDDTLSVTTSVAAAKTTQYSMAGIETVAVGALGGALTFSAANAAGISAINATATMNQDATFVNLGTADITVNAQGTNANTVTLTSTHTGATTLNITADDAEAAAEAATAEATDMSFDFAATTDLVVNAGAYTNATGTIEAATATSVVLNVTSGMSTAATPAEVTSFEADITAAKATSFVANVDGELTGSTITVAKATDVTITNGANAIDFTLDAAVLESFTLVSGAAVELADASDLTAVQVADITVNDGAFDTATTGSLDLESIANLTVAGSGVTNATAGTTASSAVFGVLGYDGAAVEYGATINASGLKGGLTIESIDVAAGFDVNVDASEVTGDFTITTGIGYNIAGKNVTVTTAGTGGDVTIGTVDATGTVAITNASTGTFDLDDVTSTGNITVDVNGTNGAVGFGIFEGNNVTIDAGDTIGGVTWTGTADVTAKTSATVVVSELQDNAIDIVAGTGSTAFTASLTGGIGADDFTITGVATNTSITVTGNLDVGTDTVAIENTSTEATSTISISGLTNYETSTITAVDGSIETITLGAGADTVVLGAADVDKVVNFTSSDKISFANAVTFESITDDGTVAGAADLDAAIAAAFVLADAGNDAGIEAISFAYASKTYISVEAAATGDETAALTVDVTGISSSQLALLGADNFIA